MAGDLVFVGNVPSYTGWYGVYAKLDPRQSVHPAEVSSSNTDTTTQDKFLS